MLYELRFYSVTHGRMADVLSRFTEHLPPLFARHQINCVGGWTALAGPNVPRFVYLMAHADFAQRESVWNSFYADPDWVRVRAETNAGHEMVERYDLFFLKPSVAWQLQPEHADTAAGFLHELVLQEVAQGQNATANEFMRNVYLPVLRESGARTLGIFDMVSGTGQPQMVMVHAWQDARAWHAGRAALEAAPSVQRAFTGQRQKLGHACFGRSQVTLLEPVAGRVHPTLGRMA